MTRFLHGMIRAIAEAFPFRGPVHEIGSYQVEGQEKLIDLRSMFAGQEYLGVDFRAGPGVDLVANVEKLPFPDGSVGTVLALSTFEHVQHFWKGFDEVYRVLRSDGILVVSCPFYFHVHGYPSDYWRFTPYALDMMLERYPHRILGWHGPDRRPINVWAVAWREDATPPTEAQFQKYQTLLQEYAQERLALGRRIAYSIGRVLCGRRPFATYLDRNRWKTEWKRPAA